MTEACQHRYKVRDSVYFIYNYKVSTGVIKKFCNDSCIVEYISGILCNPKRGEIIVPLEEVFSSRERCFEYGLIKSRGL